MPEAPSKPARERKHGRGCYARPCELGKDCEARKAAARADTAKRRAKAKADRVRQGLPPRLSIVKTAAPAVADSPAEPVEKPVKGSLAEAIGREIDSIPRARANHPGAVALIEAIAAGITSAELRDKVAAARQIAAMMAELRPIEAAKPVKNDRAELLAALAMPL